MASSTAPPARRKIVHQLGTPFSAVAWPEVSSEDQDTILELLCNLLSPIGQHRRNHIKPSKGKRAAKRKRMQKSAVATTEDSAMSLDPPPKPELSSHIDAGFNAITRTLQGCADQKADKGTKKPYSIVFVSRGNQTSAFNCQFPQMVAASAKDMPPDRKTRLVGFSKPCSEKLSSSLGIARVSSVAIAADAPGVDALWELVRQSVKPVQSSWLPHSAYNITQIKSIETTVGPKKTKAT